MEPKYAGAIVNDGKGRVLCQLRDDKEGVLFPGIWTCAPGGHIEKDEDPKEAIIRELYEEFEVRVKDVRLFKRINETRHKGAFGIYYIFDAVCATDPGDVKCHEGKNCAFFDLEDAVKLEQHPISLRVLTEYIKAKGK